jgi:uncharacterized cupredoxin-like copper-binding protein
MMRKATTLAAVLTLLGAATAGAQQQAQAIDPTWLSVDTVARLARFQLVAGLTGLNGALNFNGFADGGLTFVVPVGWRTEIDFTNHDGMLPHSAEIITPQTPLPTQPAAAAIPRAFTLRLAEGLAPQGTDTMRFVAQQVGDYLIFCAVPGHGAAGMWIRFQVSASAKAPALR